MSCKFAMTQIVHSQVMCMEDQCFVHQCVWTSYWQNDGDRSADSTITREAICRVSGAGTHLDCAFSSIPINNLLSIFSYFALVSFSTPPPAPHAFLSLISSLHRVLGGPSCLGATADSPPKLSHNAEASKEVQESKQSIFHHLSVC